MELFGDSISNLRYGAGIVSFTLNSAAGGHSGVGLNIPFADFSEIALLFSRELKPIGAAHDAWIAEEAVPRIRDENGTNEERAANSSKLGVKIATV